MEKENILSNINIKISPIRLAMKIIGLGVFFNAMYGIISLIADSSESFNNGSSGYLTYDTLALLLLIILQTLICIYLVIDRSQEYYLIKKGFIIHKTGIFFKKETRIKLANVQAITYNQTFRGKFLEYGNIEIIHEGEHSPKTILRGIANPEQFIYFLEQNE